MYPSINNTIQAIFTQYDQMFAQYDQIFEATIDLSDQQHE